jgi:DNA-binding CsgD family transcriptional regulator
MGRRRPLVPASVRGVEKGNETEEDVVAMELSANGHRFIIVSEPVADETGVHARLTDAERKVVTLILEGRSNAEIAQARSTSPRTIANQVAGIFRKLGVGSRAELAALCVGPSTPISPSKNLS